MRAWLRLQVELRAKISPWLPAAQSPQQCPWPAPIMCPRALPLPAAVVVDVSVAAQYAMPVGRRTRAARRVERRVAVFLLARVTGNVAIAVAELVISTATRVTRTLSRRRRIFFVVVATSVGETRFTSLPLLLRELVAAATDAAAMDATVCSALIMTPSRSPCCRLFQRVESTALAVRVVLTLAVACGPTASAPACPPSRRLAQAPSPCTRRCVWSSPCPVALTT